jgi:hypothetical protein
MNIFGVSQDDSARTVSCAAWCVRQPANAKLANKSAQAHPLGNKPFIEGPPYSQLYDPTKYAQGWANIARIFNG